MFQLRIWNVYHFNTIFVLGFMKVMPFMKLSSSLFPFLGTIIIVKILFVTSSHRQKTLQKDTLCAKCGE